MFVAHFIAKRMLEFQIGRLFQAVPDSFQKPKIKILAVNSEVYTVPPWSEFQRVIREALTGASKDDVESIITILEDKFMNGTGLIKGAQTSQRLMQIKRIMNGTEPSLILRMHCEAVFAALLEARRQVQSKSSESVADMIDTGLERMAEIFKVLGFVSRCKIFHSYFPRPWMVI
jgi:hypothetical protein